MNTAVRIQWVAFAGGCVAGPLAIAIAAFTNPPYYGSAAGIPTAIATNASDTDLVDRTHLVAIVIAAYLLPIVFVGAWWLANRASPWLAGLGLLLSLLAFLPVAVFAAQDSLFYDIARWGATTELVEVAQRANQDGVMTFYGIAFGLGSVLGPTLLGIALWRSRAAAGWVAACLVASRLPVVVFPLVPYRIATIVVLAGTVFLVIAGAGITAGILRSRSASA